MQYIFSFSEHLFIVFVYIFCIRICFDHLKKSINFFISLGIILVLWLMFSAFISVQLNINSKTLIFPFIFLLSWILYVNINLPIYKFLFVFLITLCIAENIMYLAVLIDARISANIFSKLYLAWPGMVVQWGLTIPIIFGFPKNIIIKTIKKIIDFQAISLNSWRIMCVLPFFIDIILWLFIPENNELLLVKRIGNLSILIILILSSLLVIIYYLLYETIFNFEKSLQTQEENHVLNMQKLQYDHLNDRIEEARRAKHDSKQHYHALKALIDNNDIIGARNYLNNLKNYLPSEQTITYCKNIILNSIFVYYLDLIHQLDVDQDIHINMLQNSPFETATLTVLFGNLLENTYEALKRQSSSSKYLKFKILEKSDNTMFIIIDNSHSSLIKTDNEGNIFSSKRDNALGIGLLSVKKIVKHYDGTIKLEYDQNNFCISIFIKNKL